MTPTLQTTYIALLGTSNQQLQSCTDMTNHWRGCKKGWPKIQTQCKKKCEAMATLGREPKVTLNDVTVKNTDSFTYLGRKLKSNGKSRDEIRSRLGKAGAAFGKLTNILTSKSLKLVCFCFRSLPTQMRLYERPLKQNH